LGKALNCKNPIKERSLCFGSEIDMRVLKGYGVGRKNNQSKYGTTLPSYSHFILVSLTREEFDESRPNIFTNFNQYNLPIPEAIRMDICSSKFHMSNMFDIVLCDPPYGNYTKCFGD
jgi:tRNA G10  N-methylase Trm11